MGRSMPLHLDGRLTETAISVDGLSLKAYAADASPAQSVHHAIYELADRRPALAVSMQVDPSLHVNFNDSVDFNAAIHFTRYFAQCWLAADGLPDVDVLKIEVPESATPQTEWMITRLSLDMTSRIEPETLRRRLNSHH